MKTKKTKQIRLLFVVNGWSRRGAQQQLREFIQELPENVNASIFAVTRYEPESTNVSGSFRVESPAGTTNGKLSKVKALCQLYRFVSKQKPDVLVTVGLGAAAGFSYSLQRRPAWSARGIC